MVSWSRAFKAALMFVAYSIIWDIIGVSIIVGGYLMSGLTTLALRPNGYQFVDGLIVMVFGFILMSLGNMATFFKVNTDIIVDGMAENFQHEEQKPEITN